MRLEPNAAALELGMEPFDIRLYQAVLEAQPQVAKAQAQKRLIIERMPVAALRFDFPDSELTRS